MSCRDPQSLSRADGEMLMAFVRSDDIAVGRDKLAAPQRLGRTPSQQSRIIVVRHEADFLRVRLIKDRQLQLLGDLSHLVLLEFPDRQEHMLERRTAHDEQYITLVLFMVPLTN